MTGPASEEDVHRIAARHTAPGPDLGVGIETEWFVVDTRDPIAAVPPSRTRAALGDRVLPGASRVTFEPGGQFELSGPPAPLPAAIDALCADLTVVRAALAADGLALAGLGADPLRPARRFLDAPRYAAMAAFFGAGPGRTMMTGTAALQVNVAGGTPERWRLAHHLGPVLVAAFAASPLLRGRPTGWQSTRQRVWGAMDPTRTSAVDDGTEPASAWCRYLLDAKILFVRDGDDGIAAFGDGSTLRDWLAGRGPVERPPTPDDVEYHATTLFPPVRPRGWLELRYLDSQPERWWRAVTAITTALLDDPHAADTAADACAPVAGRWETAARQGVHDADLLRAARTCVAAAREALPRLGAGPALLAEVDAWASAYVDRGRSVADDLLERAERDGVASLLDAAAPDADRRVSL